jgi:hypothetical protein
MFVLNMCVLFSSTIVGNTLVFIEFTGATVITEAIRTKVYGGLLAIGLVGVLILILGIRNVKEHTVMMTPCDTTKSSFIDVASPVLGHPAPRFINNLNWIDVDLGLDLEFGKDSPGAPAAKTRPLVTLPVTVESYAESPVRAGCSEYCKPCLKVRISLDCSTGFKTMYVSIDWMPSVLMFVMRQESLLAATPMLESATFVACM